MDTGNLNSELKVWFEQRGFFELDKNGYPKNNLIKYQYNRAEVDHAIIPHQAVLEAGPLYGMLTLYDCSGVEINAVSNNLIDNDSYKRLGKRIVKELLQPSINNLLSVLRTLFGQYWLPLLEDWDSRKISLGSYCNTIHLEWSFDGINWRQFTPTQLGCCVSITVEQPGPQIYCEYLTEKDWKELPKVLQERSKPSIAADLLASAHNHADQRKYKYAFIEAVSAFNVALSEFINIRLKKDKELKDKLESFRNLPEDIKLITISTYFPNISPIEIKDAISAIKLRNEIIHEGKNASNLDIPKLYQLMKIISYLIFACGFKHPHYSHGNELRSLEDWENCK
ncbi:MAG: hypothetical protein QME57_04135 [Patescibacteria group bacterium]|nr:hypothetical protein [Patescibacteria group bacterium]